MGFTATPRRGDKQGLGEVFEDVCYARDLREMIAERYLCPITGWRIDSATSLDNVRIRHGDFVDSDLAEAVNTSDRNNLLVSAYKQYAKWGQAIIFCVNVAHAQDVCEMFNAAGIRTSAVWGEMLHEDRRKTLARFSQGDIRVLTNCNVLTEGFDEPRVDTVIMARPTRSRLLYAQMIGRGTRCHPEKTNLVVIDISDNSKMHQLPGLSDLFNLPSGINFEGSDVLETERLVEELTERCPWVDVKRIHSPTDIKLAAKRIEFWKFGPPDEIADFTPNIWYSAPRGYRLYLKDGELLIESDLLDTWSIRLKPYQSGLTSLERVADLKTAIRFADNFVARDRPDSQKLVARDASWRGGSPSDKQIEVLRHNGITAPAELTKGQAAQMIAYILGSSFRAHAKLNSSFGSAQAELRPSRATRKASPS